MSNAQTNKALSKLVGNLLARQTMTGKTVNATQRAVMVRLQNAVAIEESCEALRSAEAK